MNAALLHLLFAALASPQPPFTIDATEDSAREFPGAPRAQSFSFAQWNGRWVIIGGRISGYHSVGGSPAEFLLSDANREVWVIDTTERPAHTYHASLDTLPLSHAIIRNQWAATGQLYYQDGSKLYICGGYGQDEAGNWVTFPVVSQVDLPQLIAGVATGKIPPQSIAFAKSPLVQSTGGELVKLTDGYFYLAMGHSFDGSYTAFEGNGEHNRAGSSQQYLNEIRRLRIATTASGLEVAQVGRFTDETEFHRRDFNLAQIPSAQGLGFAVYGGVFTPETQSDYDKPIYLFPGSSPTIDSEFHQKLNTYSAAKLLLYSRTNTAMYTTFFGGISHYSWDPGTGQIIENAKTGTKVAQTYLDGMEWSDQISTIRRISQGGRVLSNETANPSSLPAYVGANAVFIPTPEVARAYPGTDIVDLDAVLSRKTFVGYLYGGIRAFPRRFPYTKNAPLYNSGGAPTTASDLILKVYVAPASHP